MHYKPNHSLSDLLYSSPSLGGFTSKLEQLQELNQLVASQLEASLQPHCRVANLRDGKLILTTTSPTWNHKLRFCSLDLLSSLRKDPRWAGLTGIEVKVDYLPITNNHTTKISQKPKSISQQAAISLATAAEGIKDQRLADAILQLSRKKQGKIT